MKAGMAGIALLVVAGAAAAQGQGTSRQLSAAEMYRLTSAAEAKRDAARAAYAGKPPEAITAALTATLADRTKIFFQPGYGVFVEYTTADGRDRMWFPRNPHVVVGTWAIRTMDGAPRACFHYLKSHDAVTGTYEPTECSDAMQTLAGMGLIDERAGDAFGLLSDRIPWTKEPREVPAWPGAPVAAVPAPSPAPGG